MKLDYAHILENEFISKIRNRGNSLSSNHAVKSMEIDEENNRIIGTVQGNFLYHQSIIFGAESNKIIVSSCSCPYGEYCKHQAALIFKAMEEFGAVENKSTPKAANKSNQKTGFATSSKRSEFIKIPFNNIQDTISNYCKTNNRRVFRASGFSIELTMDSQLIIKLYEREHYWNDTLKYLCDVQIKTSEKSEIEIKCSECHSKSKYLCEHTESVLFYLKNNDGDTLLSNPPEHYQTIFSVTAKELSLSVEDFNKNFQLRISNNHKVTVLSKNENVILDTKRFSPITIIKSSDKEKVIYHANAALKQSSIVYALEWQAPDSHGIILGIMGKPRKRDGVINAKFKDADRLDRMPAQLKTIYKHISVIEEEYYYEDSAYECFSKIHQLLIEHQKLLQLDHHYYYKSPTSYYDTRRKVKDLHNFKFSMKFIDLKAKVSIVDGLYELKFQLIIDDTFIPLDQVNFYNELFIVVKDKAYLFIKHDLFYLLNSVLQNHTVAFLERDKDLLLDQIARLSKLIDFDIDPNINIQRSTLEAVKKEIYLSQKESAIFLEPKISNDKHTISILDDNYLIEDGEIKELDKGSIEEFKEVLESLHPNFISQLHEFEFLFLNTEEFIENLWFYDFYEICKTHDIEIYGQENLTDLNYSRNRAEITSSIKSGIDWFDVDVSMNFGDETVSQKSWIKAIKANESFVKLDDGSIGVIPEVWFKKLKSIHSNTELIQGDLKVSKFNFNVIDELFEEINDEEILEEIAQKRAKIDSIKSLDTSENIDLPKSITATLRPYQHQGYNWLRFLHENNFGGILADDMGLGKTLQVLCMLAYAVELGNQSNLIIVPRSLLFNWAKEIEKFAPSLRYLIHHGPQREKLDPDFIPTYDIIISTYDTVASDILLFKTYGFYYIVLDESQAIKNPASKRFKAMKLLKATNRLTMTGTPIENNTFDLYAQMSFVNPGSLGSMQKFKQEYSTPIDSNGDEDAAKMLKQMIYPFLLRRTKEQVATDLPEKTESIIYCDMPKDQRKKYEELKKVIKQDVYQSIKKEGLNRARFKILEGLLRLRQMCNSPQILNPDLKASSAKIDAIEDFLTGDLAGKNVLIFSQFVSMLSIIKQSLKKLKIKHAYLDGQTRKREKAVADFMEDDSCSVFLISLKAGNTGLNLVKADYVFIVDPWWNPAVEAQAIDRTHRIGQDKHVFAYRLICTDSIEEKIMALKAKKRKVASDIINVDDKIFKSMNKDQILNLFE